MGYCVVYTNCSELYHHGTLGMKWGVWNDETRARYMGHKQRKKQKKDRYAERKDVRSMSDKELNDKIQRLRNEKTYRELVEEDVHPGKAAVKHVLGQSAKKVGTIVVTAAALAALSYVAFDMSSQNREAAELWMQAAANAETPERKEMCQRQFNMYNNQAESWKKFERNLQAFKK